MKLIKLNSMSTKVAILTVSALVAPTMVHANPAFVETMIGRMHKTFTDIKGIIDDLKSPGNTETYSNILNRGKTLLNHMQQEVIKPLQDEVAAKTGSADYQQAIALTLKLAKELHTKFEKVYGVMTAERKNATKLANALHKELKDVASPEALTTWSKKLDDLAIAAKKAALTNTLAEIATIQKLIEEIKKKSSGDDLKPMALLKMLNDLLKRG